jgi:very-short-patch-repair endonuclease
MFQRYGPINMEKGENRINVLVTRAKKRVVVCSSMNPNDITAQNSGPQVLRRYLQYAKTGQLEDTSTRNEPDGDHWYDAPWEKWFHDRLEADGYIVNPQVGVSGWRIDLGVMHEDFPNGYLCGVELDGKDHLRQSARDRDIERQAILESKGWTILRVWSIDFFDDMEGEYQILKSAIDEILEKKRVTKPEIPEETIEDFMEEENELVKADLLDY